MVAGRIQRPVFRQMTAPTSLNDRLSGALRAGRAAPLLLAAVLLVFIVLGHDIRRAAQMVALALPLGIWLAWPLRSVVAHRLRAVVVWALAMLFVLDGAVRVTPAEGTRIGSSVDERLTPLSRHAPIDSHDLASC